MSPEGPRSEIADVVRLHGRRFTETHAVSIEQRAIESCRTAALGGHVDECDRCGERRISYNSCRNRHCPKCQGGNQAKWVEAQQASLLPIEYFHVVFTLPHTLNPLVRVNRQALYGLLFRAAADTLLCFGHDPDRLGAEIGVTAVLHTWGQNLTEHVHLHCVVTGGGLTADGRCRRVRKGYLFPVKALGRLFRGKYRAGLRKLRAEAKLRFVGQCEPLADEPTWEKWLAELGSTDWVVYSKPPFGGPEQVLKYLGRYTHRIALSNRRILHVGEGVVRFAWKDYRDGSKHKVMELSGDEFLRRFLLHVVPKGFMRIRHFGLLANRHRKHKLGQCREILGVQPALASAGSGSVAVASDQEDQQGDRSPTTCRACGEQQMKTVAIVAPQRGPPC